MMLPQSKNIVLFDFDGVLVDTIDMCFSIYQHFHPGKTRADYEHMFLGNVYDAIIKQRLELREDPDGDGSYRAWWDMYTNRLPEQPMLPTMERIVPELARRYQLAIVTSSIESPIADYFDDKTIRHHFDWILDSNVHRSKVAKIAMAKERYGGTDANYIFVTDTLGDISEATKAGVQSIGVTWGMHNRVTLEEGSPYAVIDKPAELIPAIDGFFA